MATAAASGLNPVYYLTTGASVTQEESNGPMSHSTSRSTLLQQEDATY